MSQDRTEGTTEETDLWRKRDHIALRAGGIPGDGERA